MKGEKDFCNQSLILVKLILSIATHAESDAKVLNDLEESRIRAVEAQKRELMLKDKLEKTSKMLEQIKEDRASKKLVAEEKEQYNAAVMKAAIKYTGLELVIIASTKVCLNYHAAY